MIRSTAKADFLYPRNRNNPLDSSTEPTRKKSSDIEEPGIKSFG